MTDTQQKIHNKIVELVRRRGNDARSLGLDDSIPESGLLDSPSLLDLILWFEDEFGLEIDQEQLTVENFGTVNSMAAWAERPRP